jgi:hypothetical protein
LDYLRGSETQTGLSWLVRDLSEDGSSVDALKTVEYQDDGVYTVLDMDGVMVE